MVKTDVTVNCLIGLKVALILLFIIVCICSHSACVCVCARLCVCVCDGVFVIVLMCDLGALFSLANLLLRKRELVVLL